MADDSCVIGCMPFGKERMVASTLLPPLLTTLPPTSFPHTRTCRERMADDSCVIGRMPFGKERMVDSTCAGSLARE
jgi:hypothetical protein